MDVRPIGNNEIKFPIRIKRVDKKIENKNEMVFEPKGDDELFPRKWTSIVIITKEGEDGEETEGLGRE